MKPEPDFFLTAAGYDTTVLVEPRACWAKGRLSDPVRDDYMLVEIAPPLRGHEVNARERSISLLILSTRHKGFTLFPITEWPSYVYVARLLDERVLSSKFFTREQVELVVSAEIFPSKLEAVAEARRFRYVI